MKTSIYTIYKRTDAKGNLVHRTEDISIRHITAIRKLLAGVSKSLTVQGGIISFELNGNENPDYVRHIEIEIHQRIPGVELRFIEIIENENE